MSLLKKPFWSTSIYDLFNELKTTEQGLSTEEARDRLSKFGQNILKAKKSTHPLFIFISQFKSPIILILLITAIISFFLGDITDSLIIIIILLISTILGFWQEKTANDAVEELLAMVHITTKVLRDNQESEVIIEEIVSGDIVLLNAGAIIPADCILLESNNLFIDEAILTGETYPVEKRTGVLMIDTPLNKRTNVLFFGTHVISGSGKAIVVNTGINTEFGKISEHLELKAPLTEFEHGIKKFGFLVMRLTLILVIIIFAINMYFSRPFLASFLFALALAVGLTPELLPVIISVSLARGAKRMAKQKVIVKKLSTIENLGSMNVLCSDKTGTLTEGVMKVNNFFNFKGISYERVFDFAYLNAYFQNGYSNPIDDAIKNYKNVNINGIGKLDEIPYDFIRKRLTILISKSKNQGIHNLMITKGAIPNILNICSLVEISEEKYVAISDYHDIIEQNFQELSNKGFRILGVAYKKLESVSKITKDDEYDMIFLGFLLLFDPLKKDIPETISELNRLGVSFKIITGDNKFVANYVGQQIGFTNPITITGSDIREMSDEALIKSVNNVNIFAEIEPNQKEKIILTLKKVGNVVGYMGDGINDAPALHTADVSISVDSGVDIAKDAAEIILLEKDLKVLIEGVKEGRRTFANTNKYIYMTTSANFGNMFSMAGASLFLPFLPMLPTQILLTNLITDLPAMAIGADNVDKEFVEKPKPWNIKFIRNFMIVFGIESSIFDFVTFFVLLFILNATIDQFRTGWFLVSVITEILILLVIRTQKTFFRSRPGRALLIGTIITLIIVFIIILTPIGWIFGFTILPITFHLILWIIVLFYILMTKLTKKLFYKYFFY